MGAKMANSIVDGWRYNCLPPGGMACRMIVGGK